MTQRFRRVLIANRGEIAVRIARTLREMGIESVAVYSEADRGAPHVRACDYAYPIGPAPAKESYLRADTVVETAKRARADAIHPGYGFLSESAAFAQAVADAGLVFIGPTPEAMRTMSTKLGARQAVRSARVPVVPGSDGPLASLDHARELVRKLGYPVLLKASSGGGGKGMRFVHQEVELESAWRAARSEAKSAFGDDTVYLEKAILSPKHIEIQVFGDARGQAVWLGERECSMQRRHQKIIEETPSPALSESMREEMGSLAAKITRSVGYVGAGTCEFIFDPAARQYYFLEMNTRLQVEHPVTELCCGLDLVEAQVRVAQGEPLPFAQEEIRRQGHAIEARVYAEDPEHDFLPAPGHIDELLLPSGPGVRVDAGVESGLEVSGFYDPMIAKVAVWAADRERARRRLHRALGETLVKGLTTNVAFLGRLLETEAFVRGAYHTGTVGELGADGEPAISAQLVDVAIAGLAVQGLRRAAEQARAGAAATGSGRLERSAWVRRSWRGSL
jgi:acetyl-CoA carboxylase biotin carboxylase subunit